VRVTGVSVADFRNYEQAQVALEPGVTVVHGPIGAGKTSLLEAIYFGCVGRSCRTTNERELVRFGAERAFVAVTASNGSSDHRYEVWLEPGRSKLFKADGVRRERLVDLAERPLVCVFMPDRLEVVKGAASERRSHLDSLVVAFWPTRHETRVAYGRALVQRNALLSRLAGRPRAGAGLAGWDHELARHAIALRQDRALAIDQVAERFSRHASDLGLPTPASLRYRPRSQAVTIEEFESELVAALESDLARGFTTQGPHRDELLFESAGRDLRRFGSQGQQRVALLALLLAERDALAEARASTPVLLLDDVLSELDRERRARLLELVRDEGQTLITTADPAAVGADWSARLPVEAGRIDA
jgi:DNA replication and repair protein RecF